MALLVALLIGAVALLFAPADVTRGEAVLALAVAAGVGLLWRPIDLPGTPRLVAIGLDVGLLAIATLLVFDVTGYWGADFAVSTGFDVPADALGPIAQFHQHFYLGPANDVLHGRALLVDANSLYGIGSNYLIAGWFQLAPLGYGPFGFLLCLSTAVVVGLGWWIIRLADVPRWIAAATVALAVPLTVLAPVASPSLFPNVSGLRFLPPFALVAVAVFASGRAPAATRSPWVLAAFALFSVWSLEAVAYCGAVYLALVVTEAIDSRSVRAGLAHIARSLGLLLVSCVVAHAIFALLTRAFGGEWPDWGSYLSLFRAWSDIVADQLAGGAQPWSVVWLVGGVYVASGIGAMVWARTPGSGQPAQRRWLVAVVGMSATGIGSLSYFVSHSVIESSLLYIAFPALLVSALWISVAFRRETQLSLPWRRATVGVGALVAVMLVFGSWGWGNHRLPRTALGHLLPGGPSLGEDLRLMWDSPPVDDRALSAEALIEEHFPPDRALVLTEPDLGEEALLRTDRANLLPISYPTQDEVELSVSLPPVEDAIEELEAGTPLLLQRPLRPGETPSESLLFQQLYASVPEGERLGPLATRALEEIRARFDFEPVARGEGALIVVRLVPKDGA